MENLTLSAKMSVSYEEAVAQVRDAFAKEGFGILTEIDVTKVMKEKLDVDLPKQVILGACRPQLAYAALQANPSVGALLPCNVVVREVEGGTLVEAVDPGQLLGLAMRDAALEDMAKDATARVSRAIASLR